MPPKKKIKYGTVQIRLNIKEQINDYCDRNGLKIGRFIENLFLIEVSGSSSTTK